METWLSHTFVFPRFLSCPAFTFHQTDGLCDNVFGSEMLALCTLAGRTGGTDEQQVQAVTDNFVHYARACMINNHRSGPWARKSFSIVEVSSGTHKHFRLERSTRAGMPFEGGVSCYHRLHLLILAH